MGGHTVTGNIDRRRHAAQGAGTSGGGCQVAGAGDVQGGGALHRERRWVAGEKERALAMNVYGWGGGRKEEGKE